MQHGNPAACPPASRCPPRSSPLQCVGLGQGGRNASQEAQAGPNQPRPAIASTATTTTSPFLSTSTSTPPTHPPLPLALPLPLPLPPPWSQAAAMGGAVYMSGVLGDVTYSYVTFANNSAATKGGAVAHEGVISAAFADVVFGGNAAAAGLVSPHTQRPDPPLPTYLYAHTHAHMYLPTYLMKGEVTACLHRSL